MANIVVLLQANSNLVQLNFGVGIRVAGGAYYKVESESRFEVFS